MLGDARKSKVILAVDDAPENLALLRAMIEDDGYSFVGAPTGKKCLALLGRLIPSFILMDVQMPELDGFETCRRLRRMPSMAAVPVGFVTTRKTEGDVRTAYNSAETTSS